MRVLVVGGGVGGRAVAQGLRFAPVQVTVVDRKPHAKLSQPNAELLQGAALYVDVSARRLVLRDRALKYDVLVAATGSRARYEREAWAEFAPALHPVTDSQRVRQHMRAGEGPVVVIGAGHAGVELAAVVARMDRERRVILIEGGARILARFPEALAEEAWRQLRRLDVDVRCGVHVVGVGADGVKFAGGTRIRSRAVFWAGGIAGSEFGEVLKSEAGAALDEFGRVCVNSTLNVPGHPEIFVIGDLARTEPPLEALPTVASQQGRYAAAVIRGRMAGFETPAFEYADRGMFAVIGRGGVGVVGGLQLKGTAAWIASKLPEPLRAYSATASET